MKKKILSVFVTVAVVITGLAGFSSVMANDDISVTLNGTKIDFDVKPQIVDGRTVVPLRKIFEEIGALVKWDGETQTVSARKKSKTITMTIGSTNMQIDKGDTDDEGNAVIENVSLDVPAQVIDDRTLVPARAISEAFGLNVDWDDDTNTVIITDDDVKKGFAGVVELTSLMGRWMKISSSPDIIADTGHNEGGWKYLSEKLKSFGDCLHIVIGFVNDKDVTTILGMLPPKARYYFTNASIPRALPAGELRAKALEYGLHGEAYLSVKEALDAARAIAGKKDKIFVGGSTFIVADLLSVY